MAVCSLGHDHPDETPAEIVPVPVEPGPNENDVKIAEIEAAASIERERIYTEQRGMELESEVQRLRGEVDGMREILDRLSPPEPEPDPEPVVVPVPDPEPEPDSQSMPDAPKASPKKGDNGWWGSYK